MCLEQRGNGKFEIQIPKQEADTLVERMIFDIEALEEEINPTFPPIITTPVEYHNKFP